MPTTFVEASGARRGAIHKSSLRLILREACVAPCSAQWRRLWFLFAVEGCVIWAVAAGRAAGTNRLIHSEPQLNKGFLSNHSVMLRQEPQVGHTAAHERGFHNINLAAT